MSISRRYLIIVNPTAGAVRRGGLSRALTLLKTDGITMHVRETHRRGDAEDFAADAVAEGGFSGIIAAGGDGTVGEVVNGLRRPNAMPCPPLGILPLGTANVLAGELGIDRLCDATAAILAGRVRLIYPGRCNNRYFVQMVGVGFDAQVVAELNPMTKRRWGKLAYAWQSMLSLYRYKRQSFDITIDGVQHRAASAVIAKGHYYAGRFVLAPDIRPDQPYFQLCLFRRGSHSDVVFYAAAMAAGQISRLRSIALLSGKTIEIRGPTGAAVQADGDHIATVPVQISIDTQPLLVLA